MKIQSEKEFVERINLFRIVFAVMIVLGHCSMHFENELLPLWIIHKFNMVGVCYFFFASGLSCAYSFSKKSVSAFRYSLRKIITLATLVLVCLVVIVFIDLIFRNKSVSTFASFHYFTSNINWYVWVQLLFYIVFFFTYRFFHSSRSRVIFVTVCAIAEILVTYSWGSLSHAWYYSSLGFPMGILFHEYFDKLSNIEHTNRIIIISALIMIFSCGCLILPDNFFTGVVMRNAMACSFMLIFAYLLIKVISETVINKLRWLKGLSNYSTEIYLYQFIVLTTIADLFEQQGRMINIEYVAAVLTLTIIIAYFMHMIDQRINRKISKIL